MLLLKLGARLPSPSLCCSGQRRRWEHQTCCRPASQWACFHGCLLPNPRLLMLERIVCGFARAAHIVCLPPCQALVGLRAQARGASRRLLPPPTAPGATCALCRCGSRRRSTCRPAWPPSAPSSRRTGPPLCACRWAGGGMREWEVCLAVLCLARKDTNTPAGPPGPPRPTHPPGWSGRRAQDHPASTH